MDKNANEEEIKKAYRKRAMVHHPDRHSGATEAEQKDHEHKFKEVRTRDYSWTIHVNTCLII